MSNKSEFKKRAKKLKALGLINYDLRETPTRYKADRVARLYAQYHNLINRPDEYSSVRLSAERAKNINGAAYIIPGKKTSKVYYFGTVEKVKRKSIIVSERQEGTSRALVYQNEIFDGKPEGLFDLLDKIERLKLRDNQQITITINGRTWNYRPMKKEMLHNYLKDWVPKDSDGLSKKEREKLKNNILTHAQITTINMEIGRNGKFKTRGNRRGN